MRGDALSSVGNGCERQGEGIRQAQTGPRLDADQVRVLRSGRQVRWGAKKNGVTPTWQGNQKSQSGGTGI